jgi:hypothetical protein
MWSEIEIGFLIALPLAALFAWLFDLLFERPKIRDLVKENAELKEALSDAKKAIGEARSFSTFMG